MLAQIRKYLPLAAVAGYGLVYFSAGKGWDRLILDVQNITIDRLKSKWQNLAIAAVGVAGLYLLRHVKLPAALKVLALAGLYLLIGYNIGMAIDPVGCGAKGEPACSYVIPKSRNPYAFSGGAR